MPLPVLVVLVFFLIVALFLPKALCLRQESVRLEEAREKWREEACAFPIARLCQPVTRCRGF